MMKSICASLLVAGSCLLASLTASGAAARPLPLAEAGESRAVIVTPEDAPNPVAFAAEEIKLYLDRITGGDFEIVHAIPEDEPAIVLGQSFAEAAGLEIASLKRDGYVIRSMGRHVYIAGEDDDGERSALLFELKQGQPLREASGVERNRVATGNEAWDFERGTLHGAYHFLERLGVRWYMPGPKGEVVPSRSTIELEAMDVREEPVFELRIVGGVRFPSERYIELGVFDPEEYDALDWTLRNQRLWRVRMRQSSEWMAFNHRPARHKWGERFFDEHPEWFALLEDGERSPKYLNYTSEGMLEQTLRDMEAYFAGEDPSAVGMPAIKKHMNYNRGWHPAASYDDTFSLLPNDGLTVDTSPESRKYLQPHGSFSQRHNDYIWQFVKKVAERAEQRFPDKLITCIAYQTYGGVPTMIDSLPDNVVVGISPLSHYSRPHQIVDEADYQTYMELVRGWDAMNDRPVLYWSHFLFRHRQGHREGVPMLLPRFLGTLFTDLAKHGRYMYIQLDRDRLVFDQINRYVLYRVMWDPEADVDGIVNDYYEHYFGPAASVMGEMFDDIEQRSEQIARDDADLMGIWDGGYPAEVLEQYRRQLDEARELTEGTEYAERVELMDTWFLGKMEARRAVYQQQMDQARETGADELQAAAITTDAAPTLDGKLDETVWKRANVVAFRNNADGKLTRWETHARVLHTDEMIYVGFEAVDPGAGAYGAEQMHDESIEVFLDTNLNRDTYYWMMVRLSGDVAQAFVPGTGEPHDTNWSADLENAIHVEDNRWSMELAIPRSALAGEEVDDEVWGFNLCRTMADPPRRQDKFSSASPFMRGAFHQPGQFARLIFER